VKHDLPEDYSSPTALPGESRRADWQHRNRSWWEANPMRYDWRDSLAVEEFSEAFYAEIDRRFFEDAARYLPPASRPFDRLMPFEQMASWSVLEIGVGSGSHAELLAGACRSYTGIDLTSYATASTRKRFDLRDVSGQIIRMDAEQMGFADQAFDYIWSWGVIHHSADTSLVLREMHRVLKPGGRATVMVYHRSWLYSYFYAGFLRGVLMGGFLKHTLHELLQLNTDGAIARFYRPEEWQQLVERCGFRIEAQSIKGQKSEVLLLPAGPLKNIAMSLAPDRLTQFVTNTCRQGSFLITDLVKV